MTENVFFLRQVAKSDADISQLTSEKHAWEEQVLRK
jgi:hypothetical protein